jgi:hypothetical protein
VVNALSNHEVALALGAHCHALISERPMQLIEQVMDTFGACHRVGPFVDVIRAHTHIRIWSTACQLFLSDVMYSARRRFEMWQLCWYYPCVGKELMKSDEETPQLTKQQEEILFLLNDGETVASIARKLAPDDPKRQKTLRSKIRRLSQNMVFAEQMHKSASWTELLYLGAAARALGERASKGNILAIKLLFETARHYSPHMNHEHSGEIKISIENKSVPRPKPQEEVYDADVVEVGDDEE